MNKFTKMLIVAAALLPALCTAQVASQYRVTQVGGSVLNDLGQSAGISASGSLQVWDRNGVLTVSAGNVRQATLSAMNADSIVVGSAVLPEYSDFAQPLIWKNGGAAQRLDVKGTGGVALDINNHGDIVGTIRGIKSNGEGGTIGFLQHEGVNTYFDDFTPIALNEKGQILGGRSGSWDYWIWDKGELTELTNTGFPENANIQLFNSQGYAAGGYSANAALFTGKDIIPMWQGYAHAMNDSNMVVGLSEYENAMLYAGGKTYVLDHLMSDPAWSAWTLSDAFGINNNGDILVRATYEGAGYQSAMLLLSPVPEPAMGLMLLAGLALFYRRPAMRRTISSP